MPGFLGKRRSDPVPARDLSADPRIEGVELRRQLARTRAGWAALVSLALVVGLSVAQILVAPWFAAPLAIAAAALGVALDRWQAAVADDQRIEQDLRALTSVYHESPRTIRKWLSDEFVDDSIRNLLAAALDSEELAQGYWEQAVKPFLGESKRGFKSNWRYQVDLADLAEDVPLSYEGHELGCIPCAGYRRLHTSVSYMQRVPSPSQVYYVGAVFEGTQLPAWFERPNFLLREVVLVPPQVVSALPEHDPAADAPADLDAPEISDAIGALARVLLDVKVSASETPLRPVAVHADRSGVRWGFAVDEDLRAGLREEGEIRVEINTFMSRRQRCFPVVIGAPTRNPTVHFNYALTDIAQVEAHTFFSAERPFDPRLTMTRPELRRVDVVTEPDDWVLAGSGCLFAWSDPDTGVA